MFAGIVMLLLMMTALFHKIDGSLSHKTKPLERKHISLAVTKKEVFSFGPAMAWDGSTQLLACLLGLIFLA